MRLTAGVTCAQADTDEGQAACDRLGVEVLPTLQFWRDGAKLWEHRGVVELDQDLAEGALPGCFLCCSCEHASRVPLQRAPPGLGFWHRSCGTVYRFVVFRVYFAAMLSWRSHVAVVSMTWTESFSEL